MDNYNISTFYGLLIKGQFHNALNYLGNFPNKKKMVNKYQELFEIEKHKSKSKTREIINLYQNYYKNVFWLNYDLNEANKILTLELSEYLSIEGNELDKVEEKVKEIVEGEGYYYLGGNTQGYYGPYIWKKTINKIYKVNLPSGTFEFNVDLMDGFISKSWLYYLSMEKIGTGGWSNGDKKVCIVKSKGLKKLRGLTPKGRKRFNLSLLHEAQHAYDQKNHPGIDGVNLEYRAKLVELIYGNTVEKLSSFSSEADESDHNNTHSYASYLLVSKLTKKVFNTEHIDDCNQWKNKQSEIKKFANELLQESNQSLKK
jgi:hypothetical protein